MAGDTVPNVDKDFDAAYRWFVDWLVEDAWRLRRPGELVSAVCERLAGTGIPLTRFNAFIRVLHPNYFGVNHVWTRQSGTTETLRGSHDMWETDTVQKSPIQRVMMDGEDWFRCRLTAPEDRPLVERYPVLGEFLEQGAVDYAIFGLYFSDGSSQGMSIVTDHPAGFSEKQLALVRRIRPYLARLTEVQADRYLAQTLLDTYVGKRTGREVMAGTIRRGSGQTIHAIIWLTDLRGFTDLSGRLSQEDLLELLNSYFDIVGEAVESAGGEILKFIGDSVLAIQPLEHPDQAPAASRLARDAAIAMRARLAAVSSERISAGRASYDFGLALHIGDVLYGNIGTESRLDFTVIGPAVNEAARIESLCGSLGEPVLMSARFAAATDGGIASLGQHRVKGLAEPVEVFKPLRET